MCFKGYTHAMPGKNKPYSQADVDAAGDAVEAGMARNRAADSFGIPRTTLRGTPFLLGFNFGSGIRLLLRHVDECFS